MWNMECCDVIDQQAMSDHDFEGSDAEEEGEGGETEEETDGVEEGEEEEED